MRNIVKQIHIIIFFLFVILYAYYLNPQKIWYIGQAVFYTDKAFLTEHLAYPGGMAQYLTHFIEQFFYFRLAGTIIIFFIVFSIWYLTNAILKKMHNSEWLSTISLIIPALTIIFIKNLNFPLVYIIQLVLTLLLSHAFIQIYTLANSFPSQNIIKNKKQQVKTHYLKNKATFLSILYFIMASLVAYGLGGRSLVVFAITIVAINLRFNKHLINSVIALTLIVFLTFAFYFNPKFFFVDFSYFFIGRHIAKFDFQESEIIYAYFLFIPTIILICSIIKPLNYCNNYHSRYRIIQVILAIILCASTLKFPLKSDTLIANEFRYLAYKNKWNEILTQAQKYKSNDRIVNFYTNKALYYTGQMSVNLFDYLQQWGEYALFLTLYTEATTLLDNCDLFYDLGHIGAARYWAFEAQTVFENNPRVLLRLIQTNLILGKPTIAYPFILKLKNSLIHKKIAEYYEKLANDTVNLNNDAEIMIKRKQFPKFDFFLRKKEAGKEMLTLLETDSTNRMAYEYLQSYYLLRNDIGTFVKNIYRLKSFNINFLPKVYDEASIVYYYSIKTKTDTIQGFTISNETKLQFKNYLKIINFCKGDLELAKPQLKELYQNTYWYYLHFISPVTLKKEIKVDHE